MKKTFTYTRTTMCCGDEDYGYKFEFRPKREDYMDAVVDMLYEDHYKGKNELEDLSAFPCVVKEGLRSLLEDNDFFFEELKDKYEDCFEEYFRDIALDREENKEG